MRTKNPNPLQHLVYNAPLPEMIRACLISLLSYETGRVMYLISTEMMFSRSLSNDPLVYPKQLTPVQIKLRIRVDRG